MNNNEKLCEIFRREVEPNLGFECADWLMKKGFFDAPASTKYHGNYEGGLFQHSFAVMNQLLRITEKMDLCWLRPESPWIIGIFHDLCKIDSYKKLDGRFAFKEDTLLKGHGEKSVMMLSELTRLTEEEILCITYHMGAFTEEEKWKDYTRAIHAYPNVLWTHTADMIASHVLDV